MNAPARDPYRRFLEAKIKMASFQGFDVGPDEINPALADHAKAIVRWALKGGRRAIFASFGLHKTAMQLELMRLIGLRYRRPTLITLPLGVKQEFGREVEQRFKNNFGLNLRFIRSADEIEDDTGRTCHLSNYETVRDGKLDPAIFIAASLDEAAVLRSFGSKTYQEFLPLFDRVRFRFVATATPSPNRLKELIHYAGFLGIMDTGQALTRFFQRNSEQANDLTLYPHKEEEFWLWVHSWAVFLQKPSDIGFSDEGFILPELDVRWHEIPTNHAAAGHEKDGQQLMFRDAAMGLAAAAGEKRDSLDARITRAIEIRSEDPESHVVLWHDLEDERRAIESSFSDAVSIHGSMELDERERRVIDFADGRIVTFATKPSLSGAGCNFQRFCAWEIFCGVGFKFHDFIQAVHRVMRFGQTKTCRIDIISTEAEREVVATLKRRWAQHDWMQEKMATIIKKYGLDHAAMAETLKRSLGVDRVVVSGDRFTIANNDCVLEAKVLEANGTDLIVTSIPFANQYEYVAAYEDMGHTDDNAHFWAQMDFLTPELLRILKPGRICCVHVKDRIDFGNVTGKGLPTVSPFHAEAIFHFRRHGFDYLGMITVITDVVRENNQTYRLGWTENSKDSTKMGVGSPEYILIMHKPQTDRSKGFADERVTKSMPDLQAPDGRQVPYSKPLKYPPVPGTGYSRARWQVDAHAFWRSSGDRLFTATEMAALPQETILALFKSEHGRQIYDHEFQVRVGEEMDLRGKLPSTFMGIPTGSWHPEVWDDVNRMQTLNSEQSRRRVEMHVCPLQFDIVDRCIERYSNPGDLVFDPFMGLGTVPYRAVLKGRRGAGVELNPTSFLDAAHYCRAAEDKASVPTLFGEMEMSA